MGPLEFMLIGFEGNQFRGEILPEINSLREKGIIRLIDALFVLKDSDGGIFSMELSDLPPEQAQRIGNLDPGEGAWFSQDDITKVAGDLDANSSVLMLLFEHAWATAVRDAILRANGRMLANERIPAAVVDEVEAELARAA
jgi:hypothetical protein